MKILPISLIVVAILGVAASTYLYNQISQTQEQLRQEISQSAVLTAEVRTKFTDSANQFGLLKNLVTEQGSKQTETDAKLTAVDNQGSQLGRDLTQVRALVTARVEAEQGLAAEIGQIKPEIAQLKVAAAAVTPDIITALTTNINALQTKVAELEAAAAKATARVKVASGGSDGVPLTAEAANAVITSDSTRFEVLNVGDKNAFVVLQAGAANEVQVGQRFVISRDGGVIAEAVASSIHDKYSVAQISPHSIKGAPKKGDRAILVH